MSNKKLSKLRFYFIFIIISLLPLVSSAKPDQHLVHDLITEYLDLIRSGNYESALGMWDPTTVATATRLGIEYNDIPLKSDCNSPVLNNFQQIRDRLNTGVRTKATIDSGLIRIQFNPDKTTESSDYFYYAQKSGDYFWFISPQDYFAADWPVYESKYFRYIVNPQQDNAYNKIAPASLDAFVEKMAEELALPTENLEILAKEKINYYLCRNKAEVSRLSGHITDGIYDKATDAIISSVFPEFHLVARLMVNFKLKQLPYFTLPFIKEGLAISLGGRWHRSPGVILDFGEYILDYELTEIDSVLTAVESNYNQMSDITFPIEACLIDYIRDNLGTDKFFKLYGDLSGDKNFVTKLTIDEVKTVIAKAFDLSWPEFKQQFNDYIASDKPHEGKIFPGQTETDKQLLNINGFVISASDKWLQIIYTYKDVQKSEANLVFAKPTSLYDKNSALFKEQYKQKREYKGYRFGIRVDRNEIGLYDYAINQLKAKYVYNFSPDPAYCDSTNGVISAYFDINLLDGILPGDSDYEILK